MSNSEQPDTMPRANHAKRDPAPSGMDKAVKQRKRRSQAERSRDMCLRLLKAATVVLRRNGYAGLRTEEVSRVAGVSRGAQLHHFPTKESLVLATTEHIFQASTARGLARAKAALTSDDPVEDLIRDGMDFFFSDDFLVLLDLVLMGEKNHSIREHIYAVARDHRPVVEAAWLKALMATGLRRDQGEQVMWLTLSLIRGFVIRSLWQPDHKLFRQLLDEWKDMLRQHISRQIAKGKRPDAGRRSKRGPARRRPAVRDGSG